MVQVHGQIQDTVVVVYLNGDANNMTNVHKLISLSIRWTCKAIKSKETTIVQLIYDILSFMNK